MNCKHPITQPATAAKPAVKIAFREGLLVCIITTVPFPSIINLLGVLKTGWNRSAVWLSALHEWRRGLSPNAKLLIPCMPLITNACFCIGF